MRNILLLRLQNQPFALDSLLYNLTEEEVQSRPFSDKWSVFENLAHLARYHEVFTERIGLMTAGGNPLFQSYKADDDPGFLEWQKKPYIQLLAEFFTDRGILNNHLTTLSTEQLQCTAKHPIYGTMNIEGWTEMFLLHEAHHFLTIVKLAAKLQPERVMGEY